MVVVEDVGRVRLESRVEKGLRGLSLGEGVVSFIQQQNPSRARQTQIRQLTSCLPQSQEIGSHPSLVAPDNNLSARNRRAQRWYQDWYPGPVPSLLYMTSPKLFGRGVAPVSSRWVP